MNGINDSTLSAQNQAQKVLRDEIAKGTDPFVALRKICNKLRPSRTRVELNDKLTRVIFKLSERGTADLLDGETFHVIEKRNYKKVGHIRTAYKILNDADYQILRPLTQFDRAVLSVCISEWLVGNRCTTPAIIYRALTGKVAKRALTPCPARINTPPFSTALHFS